MTADGLRAGPGAQCRLQDAKEFFLTGAGRGLHRHSMGDRRDEARQIFRLGVGVFIAPKVLGGGVSPMSAELIRQTFETRVNWPLGAALTLVLMVVSVFVVLLFSRILNMKRAGFGT